MQAHQWEKAVGYDDVMNKGFTDLKETAYTQKEASRFMTSADTVAGEREDFAIAVRWF